MSIKSHIPNIITMLNLLCGCISIVVAFDGLLALSGYLILLAAFFDFIDGAAARILKAYSDIGKQLDSLADVISFGMAPGIIIFHLMSNNSGMPEVSVGDFNIIAFIAFLIPLFSALRLAKFNIDQEQAFSFKGLPTPANGIMIASFPLILAKTGSTDNVIFDTFSNILYNPYFLVIFTIVFSYLLISPIRLFSLKLKSYNWKENKLKYILLLLSFILLVLIQTAAIPVIIILYIILSIIFYRKKEGISS